MPTLKTEPPPKLNLCQSPSCGHQISISHHHPLIFAGRYNITRTPQTDKDNRKIIFHFLYLYHMFCVAHSFFFSSFRLFSFLRCLYVTQSQLHKTGTFDKNDQLIIFTKWWERLISTKIDHFVEFHTPWRLMWHNSKKSSMYIYLSSPNLMFPWFVHTWQADKWLASGQSVYFHISIVQCGQAHKSCEQDCNDEGNVWQWPPRSNKPIVERVRKLFCWFLVQIKIIGIFLKHVSHGKGA